MKKLVLLLATVVLTIAGCSEDEPTPTNNATPPITANSNMLRIEGAPTPGIFSHYLINWEQRGDVTFSQMIKDVVDTSTQHVDMNEFYNSEKENVIVILRQNFGTPNDLNSQGVKVTINGQSTTYLLSEFSDTAYRRLNLLVEKENNIYQLTKL